MTARRLRLAVQDVCTRFWSSVFRVAARKGHAELLTFEKRQRILVVAPHPDDESAGCAGAILAHRTHGDEVTIVCMTDGRRSRAFGLGADEMAARRYDEMHEAARRLDAELVWLGLREGEAGIDEMAEALRPQLAGIDVIYAPSRVDFHPDHQRVACALARVLDEATVRVYGIQVPLSPILTNRLLPVSDTLGQIEHIMQAHETQLGSLLRCLRMRHYAAALAGHSGAMEELWQMTAESYARIHSDLPTGQMFRALRYDAFSDPLAYLQGRKERMRLAVMSAS